MQNEFVPYELAVKLKELGFKFYHFGYYSLLEDNKIIESKFYASDDFLEAPLFQQAFDWFRYKYNLHYIINYGVDTISLSKYWHFGTGYPNEGTYKTYQEARLQYLTKLIEIVENGNIRS